MHLKYRVIFCLTHPGSVEYSGRDLQIHIKTRVKFPTASYISICHTKKNYFCKINVQQLLEVTYIISHNSCSEGDSKFVQQPL